MSALTASATVANQAVKLELRCATAKCAGVITLVDVRTELGHGKYDLAAGQAGYATVGLFPQVLPLLAAAKDHTINATETVTVSGGTTVTKKIAVTTNAPAQKPVVAPYTTVSVSNKSVTLELRCSDATCAGTVSLADLRTDARPHPVRPGSGPDGPRAGEPFPARSSSFGRGQGPHHQRHRDGHRDRREDGGHKDNPGRLAIRPGPPRG